MNTKITLINFFLFKALRHNKSAFSKSVHQKRLGPYKNIKSFYYTLRILINNSALLVNKISEPLLQDNVRKSNP